MAHTDYSLTNLVLLINRDQKKILLAMKKRGFGEGRWNGYGGKVKDDESITLCAVRELQEEAEITVRELDLQKVAVNIFYSPVFGQVDVHTYIAEKWEGEAVETEEMRPQWYGFNEIPYDFMWQDDRHWLPEVLAGKTFIGEYWFDDKDNLVRHTLKTAKIDELDGVNSPYVQKVLTE